ncbi:MAG: helix-turn-helix transcriptional regulator [Nitrospinota bacterium]|jgi:transcriptional regulator with XRE-family HTH domain|nr:helix-turn-helix transcriptional regulator [Nitrospinota bacterium]
MKLRLEKTNREAIGTRLREVRLFNKLEQTELAHRAGLSQAIISQYEKGLTEISLSFIKFLAENFTISGDWLIFGAGQSPREKVQKEIEVRLPKSLEATLSKGKKKSGFIGIPIVDPKSAARPGKVQTDRIEDWEIVRFQEATGRNNLVALETKADWVKNMAPPFRAGGRIVIDRDDKKVRPNAYYAINSASKKKSPRDASVTGIRRLSQSGSRLWFIEDRTDKEYDYLDLKASDRIENIIIGRIIWVWQKMP